MNCSRADPKSLLPVGSDQLEPHELDFDQLSELQESDDHPLELSPSGIGRLELMLASEKSCSRMMNCSCCAA